MKFSPIYQKHCNQLTQVSHFIRGKFWNYNDTMTIILLLPLIIGWVAGWVVNYLSDVLPITRSFSKPVCLKCGTEFSLIDYLLMRGCAQGHSRHVRTWFVQVIITLLSIYTYLNTPAKIGYWGGIALLIYFGIVFVIDLEHRLILHPTSIVGGLLAFILGIISHGTIPTLLGALGGLLIMLGFYFFGMLFAKIRSNRMRAQGYEPDDEEALGQGDVILVTVLGFLVGWPLIWFMIIVSVLLGGVISILFLFGLFITRRYNSNALMIFLPYGPYFVIGAGLIVYFPNVLKVLLPS